jgi:hypothetical protein
VAVLAPVPVPVPEVVDLEVVEVLRPEGYQLRSSPNSFINKREVNKNHVEQNSSSPHGYSSSLGDFFSSGTSKTSASPHGYSSSLGDFFSSVSSFSFCAKTSLSRCTYRKRPRKMQD